MVTSEQDIFPERTDYICFACEKTMTQNNGVMILSGVALWPVHKVCYFASIDTQRNRVIRAIGAENAG